jgi:transposase
VNKRLENETDSDILRSAVRLLAQENELLTSKLKKALTEIAALKGTDKLAAFAEIERLQAQIAAAQKKIFGASSEKTKGTNPDAEVKPKPKQKGHGPTPQPNLERIEMLPLKLADDVACPACGGELATWEGQDEVTEEVSIIERKLAILVQRREKKRCSCGGCIQLAPAPPKLREGGRYNVSVAIEVAVSKYLDHLPLERQCRMFAREGLQITSQTLWDQIESLATWLHPAWVRLRLHQLSAPLLYVDETHWKLSGKRGDSSRWWAWVSRSQDGAYFELKDSRSADAGNALLAGYTGRVMSDGYASYESIRKRGVRENGRSFVHAHCWAHARRKFVELETSFPQESKAVLDRVNKLFMLEREFPEHQNDDATLSKRDAMRREKSAPLVRELGEYLHSLRALPQSGLGKAVQYVVNQWAGLTVFLKDPLIPLSNNAAERVLRGPVVGRKNYYGSRSERGCEVAAILYSLLESAKLCGIDPKAYLRAAIQDAFADRVVRLPHELKSEAPLA